MIEIVKNIDGNYFYKGLLTGKEGVALNILISELCTIKSINDLQNTIIKNNFQLKESKTYDKTKILDHLLAETSKADSMIKIIKNLMSSTTYQELTFKIPYFFEIAIVYGIEQLALLSGGELQLRDFEDFPFWYNQNGIRVFDSGLNRMLIITHESTLMLDSFDKSYQIQTLETTLIMEMVDYYKSIQEKNIITKC